MHLSFISTAITLAPFNAQYKMNHKQRRLNEKLTKIIDEIIGHKRNKKTKIQLFLEKTAKDFEKEFGVSPSNP